MEMSDLTEALIARHASAEILRRGDEYRRRGAVETPVKRGDTITAEVKGSDAQPYRVTVRLGADDIAEARCTCPYEWGGWCKHVAAVLLLCAHAPELVDEQPPLDALLADLDREALAGLLLRLLERHPYLVDEAALLAQSGAPAPSPAPDARLIRRQVRAALRGAGDYGYGGGALYALDEPLQAARMRVEAGDGRGALVMMEALTEEFVDGWTEMEDEEGEWGDFFGTLGDVWTEAILSADLTPKERAAWEKRLAAWARSLDDYGEGEGLGAAAEAARRGWDDPALARVLRGEAEEDGEEDFDEEDDHADALNAARGRVLERQGRWEEALRLAAWSGAHGRAAALLVTLGRHAEAEDYAARRLAGADEFLTIARKLQEAGENERALRVAERGLDGEERGYAAKHELAAWLRDRAEERGQADLALRAATVAVRERPDLADWQRLPPLAGSGWPNLRRDLLAELKRGQRFDLSGTVDILLHEGLTGDALAAVKDSYDHRLIGRVVDAAATTFPDEVIPICRAQAESIMDGGKSSHYQTAARWLERARTAYRAANREAEWRTYLDDLKARHRRKYTLLPLLKAL